MRQRVHTAAELGSAIAEFRRDRGMSQAELAEWLAIDRTTVVRLEAGRVAALVNLMRSLALIGAELVIEPRDRPDSAPGEPRSVGGRFRP